MITATDASGATGTDTFTVVVANTNDAPTLANALADATVAEDAAYTLDVSAMCADVDVGDCVYSLAGAPTLSDRAFRCHQRNAAECRRGTHTI